MDPVANASFRLPAQERERRKDAGQDQRGSAADALKTILGKLNQNNDCKLLTQEPIQEHGQRFARGAEAAGLRVRSAGAQGLAPAREGADDGARDGHWQ